VLFVERAQRIGKFKFKETSFGKSISRNSNIIYVMLNKKMKVKKHMELDT